MDYQVLEFQGSGLHNVDFLFAVRVLVCHDELHGLWQHGEAKVDLGYAIQGVV